MNHGPQPVKVGSKTTPQAGAGRCICPIDFDGQIAIMVKTQVQIPDHLFREAKRLAAESEMSFAHVVRLGLEMVVRARPAGRLAADRWRVPKGKNMGLPRVPEDRWTEIAHEDEL